jgi:hypothetical protein
MFQKKASNRIVYPKLLDQILCIGQYAYETASATSIFKSLWLWAFCVQTHTSSYRRFEAT